MLPQPMPPCIQKAYRTRKARNCEMKMFEAKNAVVLVVLLLVVLQSKVEPQPTIDSFEGELCSKSEEECRILREENDQLKLERDQLLAKTLQRQPVAINLIQAFSCRPTSFVYGVTATLDKIYVLCYKPNLVRVFENRNQFQFLREIALNATKRPSDIVYSNETKCFYIGDADEDCIWKMTTTKYDYRLTKWLTNANKSRVVSVSTDGQVLKLKNGEPFSELIIYDWNARVVRDISLPEDIKDPRHAVQTLTGNFILIHRLNDASNGTWMISQVNNAGQLIHRFIPRSKSEELDRPFYLSLDSENNRLFVADTYNHRVILFDSISLIWIQVLLSKETNGITRPGRLFYDVNQRRLMVAQFGGNVNIYDFERNSLVLV